VSRVLANLSPVGGDEQRAAEQRARLVIDGQLRDAGWAVVDRSGLNLLDRAGSAVREVPMAAGHGRADYLLYVDRKVVGVIEAKPVGTPLSGVEWQSAMYATGVPADMHAVQAEGRLPFVFEASGSETYLTNGFDPHPRARMFTGFPRAETLARWLREAAETPDAPTWRAKVAAMEPLHTGHLRPAQIIAIEGIERSLAQQQHARSLVQMATGAGKTFTAVTECYRLLKWGGFNRVLFLVDRNNLGDQTMREFGNYTTPDDGRKFTELYNVDKLTAAGMVGSSAIVVSTIQRVFRVLSGESVADTDDPHLDGYVPDKPVEVGYSAALPPESFDLVIVDECHRSIYGSWRGVLEYFDAHVVGLTATPVKQTFGFFEQNLVSEYTYPQSVADGVNVDFDVYRITTKITAEGSTIEAGTVVPRRDRRTRQQKLEALAEDFTYQPSQLDRAVTATDQIRTVLETFRDRLSTEIFPGRTSVPKTLIFAKDDNHAEEIVRQVRAVFGKGNDFAAKITYSAKDAKARLQEFRNSPTLRIAVTVDMIATGTDVRPLECVFFMRDVRSGTYFEQMKGRGSRTIAPADFQAVTPDAATKDRFVLVDAVGVTEHDFVDAAPLDRERGVSLQRLLEKAATLTITEDEVATLASRLARLDQQIGEAERAEIATVAGQSLHSLARAMVDAIDADAQATALAARPDDAPAEVLQELLVEAVTPLAGNPELRTRLLEIRRAQDLTVDEVSVDELVDAHGVVDTDRARVVVVSWREYLEANKDEITALQVLYRHRKASFAELKELADRIRRPPYNWTPDVLWQAYAALDETRTRVTRADRHTVTDLIALVRHAIEPDSDLVPFSQIVQQRYEGWLAQQTQAGATFTAEQRWWLDRIAETVATANGITVDDLDEAPFTQRGGIDGAVRDLGPDAQTWLDQLNAQLTA
jgi:type I restriction enzyme R subunit